jgi:hypothetical protein
VLEADKKDLLFTAAGAVLARLSSLDFIFLPAELLDNLARVLFHQLVLIDGLRSTTVLYLMRLIR